MNILQNIPAAMILAVGLASSQDNFTSWAHAQTLRLDASPSGAGIAAPQTQYPVLVRLTSAHAAVFALANPDGSDLRFSTVEGVPLAYEIDHWDGTTMQAAVWVLLPQVAAGGWTEFRMHYGNPAAASASNGANVFGVGNSFRSVWHLGAASGQRPNAVQGGSPAVPVNFPGVYAPVTGVIGLADTLGNAATTSASTGIYFDLGTGYDDFSPGFTYSAWVRPAAARNFERFFEFAAATGTGANRNIALFRHYATGDLAYQHVNGVNWPDGTGYFRSPGAIAANQWNHYALTVQGSTILMYKNGVRLGVIGEIHMSNQGPVPANDSTASAPIIAYARRGFLGRSFYTTDQFFTGSYDEVRLSRVARSPDWMKLDFKTQKPGVAPVFGLSYPNASPTYNRNQPIDVNLPAVSGTPSRYQAAGLPAGLSIHAASGIITGIPTEIGSFEVTVTAHGDSAWAARTTLQVTVTDPSPIRSQAFRFNGSRPHVFALPTKVSGPITLRVTDTWGRTVWSARAQNDGRIREVEWDGRSASGRPLPAGMYVMQVEAAGKPESARRAPNLK